jgi:transcriptional regulator with XRE-family HTH domain
MDQHGPGGRLEMAGGQMTAVALLVAELRRARMRRGWSQDELAKAVNYSASMVSAIELGQQPPTAKYLELVDKALDTGGIFGRMLTDLVSLDKAQVWLRGWRAILGQARVLRWFDPLHVPGLFQTEAYARAVFESDETLTDASELAFLGGQIGGQELTGPSDLLRLQRTWEAALGAALPAPESIELMREVAESWS